MADTKISNLPSATTPLAGTETLPIVQSSTTKKVSADNLWAGRSITFSAPVSATPVTNGVVIIDTTGTNPTTGSGGGLLFQQQNSGGVQTNYASITGYRLNSSAHDIVELAIATGSPGDARPITKRMSFDTLGNVTVTNGNLVMGTSGSGIDFSATSGSGTSELLADYEKGTFTPTVIGTTTAGTATYAYAVGNYVKVGDAVNFQIIISWSAGTGTGDLALSGLPFTAGSSFYSVSLGRVDALALTASNIATAYVEGATTNIIFAQTPVGGGAASQVPYDANVDGLFVSGTYLI